MHREDGLPCVAIVHYFFLFYTSSRGVREICLWELSLTVLVLASGTSLYLKGYAVSSTMSSQVWRAVPCPSMKIL